MSSTKIGLLRDSLPGTSNYKSVANRVPDLHPINRLPSSNSKFNNNLPTMDSFRSNFTFEKNIKSPSFFKNPVSILCFIILNMLIFCFI